MSVLQKYGLTFSKGSNGRLKAYSEKEQIIGEALQDFRGSVDEIVQNAQKYVEIVSKNPPEKNTKGSVSDEEYYKYWGIVGEIDSYGCDRFYLDLSGKNAEISEQFSDWNYELPIDDLIEILLQWKHFLNTHK